MLFDRRTKKSVDLDGAGSGAAVASRYVYDGEDILATTNSSGTVTSRLLHGPAVDQILAIETASNGAVHWALTDQLGSVRDIVDNSGTVANHIVYDSFGNVASETASSVDYLFGFTGRERDEESDLNYHRARYYSASIGRWLSEDPIGFSAGDTNLRRYVNNNPVNFTDPSGNVPVSIESTYDDFMWHGSVTEHYWIDNFFLGGLQGDLNNKEVVGNALLDEFSRHPPGMLYDFIIGQVGQFNDVDTSKLKLSNLQISAKGVIVDEGYDGFWGDMHEVHKAPMQIAVIAGSIAVPLTPGGAARVRRKQTEGNIDFTAHAGARHEALRRWEVDTSKSNNHTVQIDKESCKNPNLRGPNGEPTELLIAKDLHGKKSPLNITNGDIVMMTIRLNTRISTAQEANTYLI